MITKITGEAPFQVLSSSFSISPSLQNYVLQISADGKNYSDLFSVSAGQTKMCTGMANGSYYRLKNNASEVTINWRSQCNDGQGGGSSNYAESAGTADYANSTKLLEGISALPQDANAGDVVAVSTPAQEGTWELFDASEHPTKVRILTTGDGTYLLHFNNDNLYTGLDYAAGDPPSFDGSGWGLYQDDTYNWHYDNDGYYISVWVENEDDYWYIYAQMTQGEGGFSMLDAYQLGSESDMYVGGTDGSVGVYQFDGTNWNAIDNGGAGGSDVVHLDSLSGTGSENILYECDEMLWVWSDSAGTVAEWTDSLATLGNYRGYGLIFSHIPEGQVILEFRNGNGTWRKIKMINDVLTLTEADDTVVTSCTIGNKVQFDTSSYNFYWVKVNYKKHWIGFEVSSSVSFQNIWDGTVQGGHFVITDHSNHPWSDINTDYGVPVWDDKGWVVHKQYSVNTKSVKVNRTSYQSTSFLTTSGEGNFPDRIYVPTAGGTAGQILQSSGTESAPIWTNWIKVVKITSAAYEALTVKDPNTLYCIDDES